MSKLILCLHAMMPVGALATVAQAPSERDEIVALIEKLGGKATLDQNKAGQPIVAVDI